MDRSSQSTDRDIRVFISSTFLDMHEERDILIKKIFPQLRKMCEERAVTWTEVDLRWGITDEQKAEGKVLPLCLEEIQRCRPYFIGLLGERYGSMPSEIPPDLIERQPWLQQHRDKSITALEIIHGVLRDQEMHGHAYFYFRDPRFVESVPDDKRQNFAAENPRSAEKLAHLKNEIRRAHDESVCGLRENCPTPETLGEWILEDFTKLIDRLYPKDETPSSITQEAAQHEAFARSCRTGVIRRNDLLQTLDLHTAKKNQPLVVSGPTGSGKSSLIADWLMRRHLSWPEDIVFQHFIGCAPNSDEWENILMRLCQELKAAFNLSVAIPSRSDSLPACFTEMIAAAPRSHVVVLAIDGLDRLSDERGQQLAWLPSGYPSNFRIVLSSANCEALNVLRRRTVVELKVSDFSRAESIEAATAYFRLFSKTPPLALLNMFESSAAVRNPLYLRILADELRQFGLHDQLLARAEQCMHAPTIKELFGLILARWEADFGAELVMKTLALLWAARRGLSEVEVLELLGEDGQPLPRGRWTPLFLAVEGSLIRSASLLKLFHAHARKAVEARYLRESSACDAWHGKLADYFESAPTGRRRCEELPWQLQRIRAWPRLVKSLTERDTFHWFAFNDARTYEFHEYWHALKENFGADPVACYNGAFPGWGMDLAGVPKTAVFPEEIFKLAGLFIDWGNSAAAEKLLRDTISAFTPFFGEGHPVVAAAFNVLAISLQEQKRFKEAEAHFRKVVQIYERELGPVHPRLATALNNLAVVLKEQKHWIEAEEALRRALFIDEGVMDPNDLNIAMLTENLGLLLKDQARFAEAEPFLRRALQIRTASFGAKNDKTVDVHCNLVRVLRAMGRRDEAQDEFAQLAALVELPPENLDPQMGRVFADRAAALIKQNRAGEAEMHMRRAIDIWRHAHGIDNPVFCGMVSQLGMILAIQQKLPEAEQATRGLAVELIKTGRIDPSSDQILLASLVSYTEILMLSHDFEEILNTLDRLAPNCWPAVAKVISERQGAAKS